MSERSARQRAFLAAARKSVAARMQFGQGFDEEDAKVLTEIEFAKEVASAMFLGGEYGVNPGTSLEQYIADNRYRDSVIKEKDRRIADLEADNAELRRRLAAAGVRK